MAVTKITKENISDVSATKLTGTLPAIDGQFLSNLPAGEIMVKSASNPTNTANNSAGTMWINTTTGEMFVCTDATTDANAWTNVGPGETEVETSYSLPGEQGQTYGYFTGGGYNIISRFAFATDGNGDAEIGTTTTECSGPYAVYSATDGYVGGGADFNYPSPPGVHLYPTTIEKFAFASSNPSGVVVGDMGGHGTYGYNATASDISNGYGYINGGRHHPSATPFGPTYTSNRISRFAYASNTLEAAIGTLQIYQDGPGCMTDKPNSYCYYSGGMDPSGSGGTTSYNYKYAFASNVSSTQWSTQLPGNWHYWGTGAQSATDGFLAGGYNPAFYISGHNYAMSEIQQITFASSNNSTLWGSLTAVRSASAGHSSATHGYATHGNTDWSGNSNRVDKFSFSSSGNSTDVADITTPRGYMSGLHV